MSGDNDGSTRPHRTRLDPSRSDYGLIIAAHDAALAAGVRVYLDPSTGLIVQTREAHLERGTCCNTGCRHCPWVTPD